MEEKSFAYSECVHGIETRLAAISARTDIVDSLTHPSAVLIRHVLTRSGRAESHLLLIDDEENIVQALDAGVQIHSLYYSGVESISAWLLEKLPPDTRTYEIARRTCKKLFENDKISRVFAIAHAPAALHLDTLMTNSQDFVALEDLTISGNIGAIVRTAVAFGVGGLVLLNAEPVDVYDRRVIRASRGYIFALLVVTATTEEFVHFCRDRGVSLVIMAAEAEHHVQDVATLPQRFAITFGREKDGCSPRLKESATWQVQIPTSSRVESLNVSTAAGIMLYNRTWFNRPQVRK